MRAAQVVKKTRSGAAKAVGSDAEQGCQRKQFRPGKMLSEKQLGRGKCCRINSFGWGKMLPEKADSKKNAAAEKTVKVGGEARAEKGKGGLGVRKLRKRKKRKRKTPYL